MPINRIVFAKLIKHNTSLLEYTSLISELGKKGGIPASYTGKVAKMLTESLVLSSLINEAIELNDDAYNKEILNSLISFERNMKEIYKTLNTTDGAPK